MLPRTAYANCKGNCLVGVQGYDSAYFSDLEGDVCETKLWVYHPDADHVNQTTWLYFDGTSWWTEAGIADGAYVHNDPHSPVFYWADDNSQYHYSEHFATYGPAAGSQYYWKIQHRTGNWWNVNIAGYSYGSGSWQDTIGADIPVAGLEYTNPNSGETSASGSSNSFYWVDFAGHTGTSWPNPSYTVPNSGGAATGFWYHQYWYFSDRTWDQPWTC
jgi:hypothetical protein